MDQPESPAIANDRRFPCEQCGAKLKFAPGTQMLRCGHCGHENPIGPAADSVEELDFHSQLSALTNQQETVDAPLVKCSACAAEITRPANITAMSCPFCGSDIVMQGSSRQTIRPRSLLPFKVTRQQAVALFRTWIGGLWFAPGGLKKYARGESKIDGLYMPAWTYDCDTTSQYSGSRGDYYYVAQTYTAVENGKTVTRTRQVRHTRWTSASGMVQRTFDDLLVLASRSLPEKYAHQLEPWDLGELVPYADDYLSGFLAERYQVELDAGFATAQEMMKPPIHADVCADIGGDEQRVDSINTQYHRVKFKHLLLPVWISAYRYRDRVFRFLVNARTGEVQGERPWSAAKITLLVLTGLTLIATAIYLANR